MLTLGYLDQKLARAQGPPSYRWKTALNPSILQDRMLSSLLDAVSSRALSTPVHMLLHLLATSLLSTPFCKAKSYSCFESEDGYHIALMMVWLLRDTPQTFSELSYFTIIVVIKAHCNKSATSLCATRSQSFTEGIVWMFCSFNT